MPYFDHNATTPLLPTAREAWARALDEAWYNPSSPYRDAARVHRLLRAAREELASFLGRSAEQIVFTSGATEANNAVIRWAADRSPAHFGFLSSPTEHPSVLEELEAVAPETTRHFGVDAAGRADLVSAGRLLTDGETALLACMAANNETGVLAETDAFARLAADRGVPYLCDASQWIGREPSGLLPKNAFVVGCAHKFGGPKGVGFLALPESARDFAGARGGEQENGHRAGTENYPAVAAMVAALKVAESQTAANRAERQRWRDEFITTVGARIAGTQTNGLDARRLWNTVSLTMPRFDNTRWVSRLDRLGFQVSTGSACATGSEAPSHVLAAMGRTPDETRRTIRVSAGWQTAHAEWVALGEALRKVWNDLEREGAGENEVISP